MGASPSVLGWTLFDMPMETDHASIIFNVEETTLGKEPFKILFELLDESLAQALSVCLLSVVAMQHIRSVISNWTFPEWHVLHLQLFGIFLLYALIPCFVNPDHELGETPEGGRSPLTNRLAGAAAAFLEGFGALLIVIAVPRRLVCFRSKRRAAGASASRRASVSSAPSVDGLAEVKVETEMGSSTKPLLDSTQEPDALSPPNDPPARDPHDCLVVFFGCLAALLLLLVRPLLEVVPVGNELSVEVAAVRFAILPVGLALSLFAGVEVRRQANTNLDGFGFLFKYARAAHFVFAAFFTRAMFRYAGVLKMYPGVPFAARVITNAMAFMACFVVTQCVNPAEDEVVIASLDRQADILSQAQVASYQNVATFLAATRSNDRTACGRLLEADPSLLEARDAEGRTASDLARRDRHFRLWALLLAVRARSGAQSLRAAVCAVVSVLGPLEVLREVLRPPVPIAGSHDRLRRLPSKTIEPMGSERQELHPAWPGAVHDKGLVVAPWEKLPAEQEKEGLRMRNAWPWVSVDLYTSRLRSLDLTIILVSLALMGRAVSNIAGVHDLASPLAVRFLPDYPCTDVLRLDHCFHELVESALTNGDQTAKPVLLFLSEVMASTCVFFVVAALLQCNNAFFGSSSSSRVWFGVLAAFFLAGLVLQMQSFLDKLDELNPMLTFAGPADYNANERDEVNANERDEVTILSMTKDLVTASLATMGLFACLTGILTSQKHNTFQRSEMAALWYTTSNFKPPRNVVALRREPPEAGDVLLLAPQEFGAEAEEMKVVVTRTNSDGTCDVARAGPDGRRYRSVLYKYLRREGMGHGTRGAMMRKKLFEKALNLPPMFLIALLCCVPVLTVLVNLMFETVDAQLVKLYRVHAVASLVRWDDHSYVISTEDEGPPWADDTAVRAKKAKLAADLKEWREAGNVGRYNQTLLYRFTWQRRNYRYIECGSEDHEPAYKIAAIIEPYVSLVNQGILSNSNSDPLAVVQRMLNEAGLTNMPPEMAELVLMLTEGMTEKLGQGGRLPLDRQNLGYLICEAKLLLRWHGFGTTVKTLLIPKPENETYLKVQNLTVAIVKDVFSQLTDYVERRFIEGWYAAPAKYVLQRLEVAVTILARDPSQKGVDAALESLFPGVVIEVIQRIARGECVDLKLLMSSLDKDGDGALGINDEAPDLVRLVMGACQHTKGTCPANAEVQMWKALHAADFSPKDGRITVEEFRAVAQAVQTLLQAQQQGASGVCGAGDAAGLLDVAKDVLDADGDGGVGAQEAADAARALQADDLGPTMLSFFDSDADGDGQLTSEELKDGDLVPTLLQLCPGIAAGVDAIDSGQATAEPSACNYLAADESKPTDGSKPTGGFSSSGSATSVKDTLTKIVKIMGEKWMGWIIIGVRVGFVLSIFFAALFTIYCMAVRYPRSLKHLCSQMQTGDRSYPGSTHWRDMKTGFAESAMFPGFLAGTAICSFVTITVVVFVVIVLLVLLFLPMVGMQLLKNYQYFLWAILLRYIFNFIFRAFILDWALTSNGEIVRPRLFCFCYFLQLFISFPLGVGLAFFRVVLQIFCFIFTSSLLDVTVLPERFIMFDSGYYSFLCVTFTSWMRQNPLRTSMITVLMGERTHRVYGAPGKAGESPQQARQRVRNRFNVAVTLFRNPELRKFRRQHGQKPEPGGRTPELPAEQ